MHLSAPSASKAKPIEPPPITYPWVPDQGDGTFCNPIIFADYSDPDVVRVGGDYYLTSSSFTCTPGLPILHSRDLVNWTIINHAVKNLPHPRFEAVQPGCGIWAPSIRFHNERFWIFFPMPDEGIYVTTAKDPAGKWTKPRLVQEGKGLIDPCPFWDDDGRAYLVHAYAGSRAGIKHQLRVRPMAPDGSRLLGEGQIVFHDPERQPTIEGPKFLKKDGWYYILAPAGGVSNGWQVALRSRNIYGPYEDRIVLEQGISPVNGPHQGALVEAADGGWWFVHFQCAGLYGRVVHLQPVRWHEGWPLMGHDRDGNGIGEPVLACHKPKTAQPCPVVIPETSDEFESKRLGLQWQWQANHHLDWYKLDGRRSRLRLIPQFVPQADLAQAPNLLLQKFPARSFAVETLLEFAPYNAGEEAGLVVMGMSYAALALRRNGQGNQLFLRFNDSEKRLAATASNRLRLRVEVKDGGLCSFSFAEDDEFIMVPHLFQASKGTWIGAQVGLYSLKRLENGPRGCVEFDYFRFSAADQAER
jgi:beta-xylosidase